MSCRTARRQAFYHRRRRDRNAVRCVVLHLEDAVRYIAHRLFEERIVQEDIKSSERLRRAFFERRAWIDPRRDA